MIDPFGSLSRLKQNVIGTVTREDHAQVMNTMIRLYAAGKEAQQKQAMAFDLSAYDHKLLKFADTFSARVHESQCVDPAGTSTRPGMADDGGMLRAAGTFDETGTGCQVLPPQRPIGRD